jgi:hypothetical protein
VSKYVNVYEVITINVCVPYVENGKDVALHTCSVFLCTPMFMPYNGDPNLMLTERTGVCGLCACSIFV